MAFCQELKNPLTEGKKIALHQLHLADKETKSKVMNLYSFSK